MSEQSPFNPEQMHDSISGAEVADLIDAGHDQVTLQNLGFENKDGQIFAAPVIGRHDIITGLKEWSQALRGESKYEMHNERAKAVIDAINGNGEQILFEVSYRGPLTYNADGEMDLNSLGYSLGHDGYMTLKSMMLALGQGKTEAKYGERKDMYHAPGSRWSVALPNGRELVYEYNPDAEFGKHLRFYADDIKTEQPAA